MSIEGRVLSGRYALRSHLADGSMGTVWTAHDLATGVPVAVKLMSIVSDRADLRARFEREAEALASLRSTHVLRVLDKGIDGATPFIVTELLDGADLLAVTDAGPPWPVAEVAALVSQVATGLEAVHAAGLVHRDVKPRNIFLARSPSGVVAKLLDFGIVKWMNGENVITSTDIILGSPLYMSPEQIRGEPLDGDVDVWALAVVAFRLLAGAPPFSGSDGAAIASRIVSGARERIAPPFPNALELERFFDHAFRLEKKARFHTPRELANALVLVVGAPSALRTAERALATGRPPIARRRWDEEDSVTNVTKSGFDREITETDHAALADSDERSAFDELRSDADENPSEIEDTQSTTG